MEKGWKFLIENFRKFSKILKNPKICNSNPVMKIFGFFDFSKIFENLVFSKFSKNFPKILDLDFKIDFRPKIFHLFPCFFFNLFKISPSFIISRLEDARRPEGRAALHQVTTDASVKNTLSFFSSKKTKLYSILSFFFCRGIHGHLMKCGASLGPPGVF